MECVIVLTLHVQIVFFLFLDDCRCFANVLKSFANTEAKNKPVFQLHVQLHLPLVVIGACVVAESR